MSKPLKVLRGVRVVSLALNLPGPAALQRCKEMGATCIKLEPPAPAGQTTSDPMHIYSPAGHAEMHEGIKVVPVNLKTEQGQRQLHKQLEKADVLITSFRQSAMQKLGVDWKTLHKQHPHLSLVAIYGSTTNPDEAGHDLTYQAQNGLVTGLNLPPTLFADMAGSLMASEAVLQCVLHRQKHDKGTLIEVGLSQAVSYLARPRTTFDMQHPKALTGGGHVGYRVYACKDGRVALAALEPHFYQRVCVEAGIDPTVPDSIQLDSSREAIEKWLAGKTRKQLDKLAVDKDIPLETLPRD
ncbi:CoA transferase [Brachymonas denitrificans]|uniref:Crotonobetainyl-CoA:carnitine CoA-transferase CaiB n=1 Tax=Brachymonas denitrificans DSM 15123 TaxID=1121117 RepID=A0A1H8FZZ0_9BURK|nr:CoA transferase [Brachymonas denitrificans]SEN37199.1 Crotonobetainyl-CoA:carnitine CoA-transferase CaiB [Brachymonas denitrificans DSM 15123]